MKIPLTPFLTTSTFTKATPVQQENNVEIYLFTGFQNWWFGCTSFVQMLDMAFWKLKLIRLHSY